MSFIWPTPSVTIRQTGLIWPITSCTVRQACVVRPITSLAIRQRSFVWPTTSLAMRQTSSIWPIMSLTIRQTRFIWPMMSFSLRQRCVVWPINKEANGQLAIIWHISSISSGQEGAYWQRNTQVACQSNEASDRPCCQCSEPRENWQTTRHDWQLAHGTERRVLADSALSPLARSGTHLELCLASLATPGPSARLRRQIPQRSALSRCQRDKS